MSSPHGVPGPTRVRRSFISLLIMLASPGSSLLLQGFSHEDCRLRMVIHTPSKDGTRGRRHGCAIRCLKIAVATFRGKQSGCRDLQRLLSDGMTGWKRGRMTAFRLVIADWASPEIRAVFPALLSVAMTCALPDACVRGSGATGCGAGGCRVAGCMELTARLDVIFMEWSPGKSDRRQ